MEAKPEFRVDPADLSKLYVKTSAGRTIPLDAVARMAPSPSVLRISPIRRAARSEMVTLVSVIVRLRSLPREYS